MHSLFFCESSHKYRFGTPTGFARASAYGGPYTAACGQLTAFVYYGKRTTTHGKRREKGVMHDDGSLRAIIPFNALTSYKYARIIE